MRTWIAIAGMVGLVMGLGCRSDRRPAPAEPGAAQAETPAGEERSEVASPGARWSVFGRVTDAAGDGLPGVVVIAHCGAGTLFATGRTLSTADGTYELRFGPGVLFERDSDGLQAATISPRKPGMIERNLHRHGDLLMANRPPDAAARDAWGPARAVVLPGTPQRVNFVMVPARAVRGRLLDAAGEPIAEHRLYLDADELPPSSSVLAACTTGADGGFAFTEVPEAPVWFAMTCPGERMKDVDSEPIRFGSGDAVEVVLTYVAGPPPRLEMRSASLP